MTPTQGDTLRAYQAARALHPTKTARDTVAVLLGNLTLRLASREYRALVEDAIHRGLMDIVESRRPHA